MRTGRPNPEPAGPGQESVWDYPRPPRLEPVPERLRVVFDGITIADTLRGWRVLETSHPPTYYLHPDDIRPGALGPVRRRLRLRVEGPGAVFRRGRPAQAGGARGLGLPEPDRPPSRRSPGTSRSMPGRWTGASSARSGSRRSRAASTAGGSPRRSSARSRASPARWGGEHHHPEIVPCPHAARSAGRSSTNATTSSHRDRKAATQSGSKCAPIAPPEAPRPLQRPAGLVDPGRDQGVEHVGHRGDAAGQRDLGALQPCG